MLKPCFELNPKADPLDRLIAAHYLLWIAFTAIEVGFIADDPRSSQFNNFLALRYQR